MGTFLTGAGGIAVITTSGVLTGAGMSGVKMMKRTKGIEEFEFLGLKEALKVIKQNKASRKKARELKSKKSKTSDNDKIIVDDEYCSDFHVHSGERARAAAEAAKKSPKLNDESTIILWDSEAQRDSDDNALENTDTKKSSLELNRTKSEEEETSSNRCSIPLFTTPSEITDADQCEPKMKQTHVLITICGFVTHDRDDHTYPFSTLEEDQNGDQYTLIWETQVLKELGKTITIILTEITTFLIQQGIQVALLPGLMAALTAPLWAIKLTYLIDNPWGNAQVKAEKVGRLLADTLIAQVQNNRPVTLVGFSLGARAIFYCLQELSERKAFGLVEEVYLCGTPLLAGKDDWSKVVSVVSGRFVNAYYTSDTLLSVLYRANAAVTWKEVAGLNAAQNPFVENINLEGTIEGHLDYYSKMPSILKLFGFKTTGDEFYDQV